MQTRVFLVNYLYNQRKGRSEVRVSSGAISDSAGATQAGATVRDHRPAERHDRRRCRAARSRPRLDVNFWADLRQRACAPSSARRRPQRDRERGVRAWSLVRAMPVELREVDNFLHDDAGRGGAPGDARGQDHRSAAVSDSFATGINWAAFPPAATAAFAGGVLQPGTRLEPAGHRCRPSPAIGPDGQPVPNSLFTVQSRLARHV